MIIVFPAYAQEPSLPAGLGGLPEDPALPSGLGKTETSSEVIYEETSDTLPFDLTGFLDVRGGYRIDSDNHEKAASLGETRLQLQLDREFDLFSARLTTDILYDAASDRHALDLERGEGLVDLREAYLEARPLDFVDLKAGRQILTWGTGDLLFINDMFPKDWVSFFTGRDVEYLKAPSDALKLSLFSDMANLDIVYTPQFDSDRYISGQRISFFNGNLGRISGQDFPVETSPRSDAFNEDEIALRLYRTFGAFETALYGYHGYWKSPAGQDLQGRSTFPSLSVWGGSLRGPIYQGIANAEIAYYDSRNDDNGADYMIRNSEFRGLVGYEQELLPELTGGVQYYLERILDYNAYRANLPAGAIQRDKNRHMLTLRLTKLMMNQNLELSLFNFYSPSDQDGYLRPKINYQVSDNWSLHGGANFFYGDKRTTFWGQFEDNTNVYAGLRYSF